MNRVRYKIGDNGFFNLAHVLEKGGFASAVTLIDVVIFRGSTEANDPSIWAHELTHVDQYRDWSVHDFAIHYARDFNEVENPAYAKGNGFWQWRAAQQQFQPQMPTGIPVQQSFGAFCCTPYFRAGPGPFRPVGTQCYVNTVQGTFFGQICT